MSLQGHLFLETDLVFASGLSEPGSVPLLEAVCYFPKKETFKKLKEAAFSLDSRMT